MLQYSIKQASEEDIRTTIMCSATGKGIERQQAQIVTDIVLKVISHLSENRITSYNVCYTK